MTRSVTAKDAQPLDAEELRQQPKEVAVAIKSATAKFHFTPEQEALYAMIVHRAAAAVPSTVLDEGECVSIWIDISGLPENVREAVQDLINRGLINDEPAPAHAIALDLSLFRDLLETRSMGCPFNDKH